MPSKNFRNEHFISTSKNLLKNRYWTFLLVRYFTWKLEFVSNILWVIVALNPEIIYKIYKIGSFTAEIQFQDKWLAIPEFKEVILYNIVATTAILSTLFCFQSWFICWNVWKTWNSCQICWLALRTTLLMLFKCYI